MSDMHAAGRQIEEHLSKLRVDIQSLKNVPGVDVNRLHIAQGNLDLAQMQLETVVGFPLTTKKQS